MTSPAIDAGDELPLTIPSLLRQQARKLGDHILLVCDDARISYADAEARSRKLARGLLAAGATKGAHVGLLHPNGPDFLVGALAAARIGAVAVPLSTLSTADELGWLLTHSDTAFLLAAPEFRTHSYVEKLQAALPELDFARPPPLRSATAPWLRRIWFSGSLPRGFDRGWSMQDLEAAAEAVSEDFLEAVEARVSPADRFVIIHTSGSTSKPKGVVHTQGAMIRYLDNLNQLRQYGIEDVLFSPSPWFWLAGFGYALFSMLIAGGRLVTSNATVAGDMLDLLERERPNIGNGWPAAVERLATDPSFAGRDMSFLRRGNLFAIMPDDVRPRDPELRHGVYGMTEVGSTLTSSPDESDQPEHLRGSFGKLVPGYEAMIVDPESGKTCPDGEFGELWVRGTFLMEGYYGRHRSQVFEPDGWLRTGDLGMFDAEGHFYFKNRLGDMIKTLGANVAPREVEAVLREVTGLPQCIVLGIPDAQRGQIVAAVVVAEHDGEVDEAVLQQKLAAKLSSYKVPRRIVRLGQGEVPMLSSGKIDMRKLVALLQGRMR